MRKHTTPFVVSVALLLSSASAIADADGGAVPELPYGTEKGVLSVDYVTGKSCDCGSLELCTYAIGGLDEMLEKNLP